MVFFHLNSILDHLTETSFIAELELGRKSNFCKYLLSREITVRKLNI